MKRLLLAPLIVNNCQPTKRESSTINKNQILNEENYFNWFNCGHCWDCDWL